MTLADRIVIMRGGVIEQVGTPDEVYNRPASMFVGGFIGAPAMNFVSARVAGGALRLEDGAELPLEALRSGRARLEEGREVVIGVRPEHFQPTGAGPRLGGAVQVVEPLGSDTLVHFRLGGATVTARLPPDARPVPGETISIGVDPSRLYLFDAGTERALA
jgi:multiple sugar transport system ATP-binding protein